MNPKTPQVDDGCSNAVPDAPVPPSRYFTSRQNKSDSSSLKLKDRIVDYLSGSRKSSDQSGAKGDRSLLSPTLQNSQSASGLNLHKSTGNASQNSDLPTPLTSTDVSRLRSEGLQSKSTTNMLSSKPGVPKEPPLKRPSETIATARSVEKPLERPSDTREEVSYCETVATFAVDVSGSTEGKVLEEEMEAVRTLCSGLSRDAFTQASIIPWSDEVHTVIRGDELENLRAGGGTQPNALNTSQTSQDLLSKCSTWFLLTDGVIDRLELECFSKGICETGLHGTPCVVILFGYKTTRPVSCNISVGLSVFSNAADCLFLFHDIDTTAVYVLQSKGVFKGLLPLDSGELILDSRTLWRDLPLFEYRQLFEFLLPMRQQLQPDDLLLQSGQKINLQELYRNHLSNSLADEIMTSNDNLQSILLAAQLRGDDDSIRHWVSGQRARSKDILVRERPDVDHKAHDTLRALVPILANTEKASKVAALQYDLRKAHHRNWVELVAKLFIEQEESSTRDIVVYDVLERLRTNRSEIDTGTHSPSMLSPVSTPFEPLRGLGEESSNLQHRYQRSPSSIARPHPRKPSERDSRANFLDGSGIPRLKRKLRGENAGALYIQHYKYQQTIDSEDRFEGTCPICKEEETLLVFLLKLPPSHITTPSFPRPNDRKGLAYPLAMGTYPETDILSSQVSCDACAYTMIKGRLRCGNDVVTEAIPLMHAAFAGEYRSTTLNLIDAALEKRFQKSSIELVFLSILYNTFADPESTTLESSSRTLKKVCSWLVHDTRMPQSLSTSITITSSPGSNSSRTKPMAQVLQENVMNIQQPGAALLRYPVGGFVILMRIIADLNLKISTKDCQLAIWYRLLFHLVERHCSLLAVNHSEAIIALRSIVKSVLTAEATEMDNDADKETGVNPELHAPDEKQSTRTSQADRASGSTAPSLLSLQSKSMPSSHLSAICGTHLLSEEDLEEFRGLDDLFGPVVDLFSSELDSFLRALLQERTLPSLPVEVFDGMKAQRDLHKIFQISEGGSNT